MLTGVLGGLYSSTATTIILSRKSKTAKGNFRQYAAAIILATAMMLLRIYLLLFIFNRAVGVKTGWWFLLLFLTAPWYIIPADHKWFSRVAIGNIIVETLKGMNIKMPVISENEKALLQKSKQALEKE